jgi:hypothetical protein
MSKFHPLRKWLLVGLLVPVLGFVGCGKKNDNAAESYNRDEADKSILKIVSLWSQYRRENKKPPASTEDLKKWVKSRGKDFLTTYNIQDVDQVFVSPRDHQPYQVLTKLPDSGSASGPKGMGGGPPGMMPIPVVVYEKVGVNGVRKTASSMGTVGEMDEEQWKTFSGKP